MGVDLGIMHGAPPVRGDTAAADAARDAGNGPFATKPSAANEGSSIEALRG